MSCDKFVFWKICAIFIIALSGIIIKLLGKLLDHLLSKSSTYDTVGWLVAFGVSLGLGVFFQDVLDVKNMWKSPFDPTSQQKISGLP